jgi:hypothetical protein
MRNVSRTELSATLGCTQFSCICLLGPDWSFNSAVVLIRGVGCVVIVSVQLPSLERTKLEGGRREIDGYPLLYTERPYTEQGLSSLLPFFWPSCDYLFK